MPNKQLYYKWRIGRRCGWCGINVPSGESLCPTHLAQAVSRTKEQQRKHGNKSAEKRYRRFKRLNLCRRCGGKPAFPYKHCITCRQKMRAYYAKKHK